MHVSSAKRMLNSGPMEAFFKRLTDDLIGYFEEFLGFQ
jgi:hypothetical protein